MNKQTKLFFFDVETTGLDYTKHGIHQLSGCIDIDGKLQEYFDFRMSPAPEDEIEDDALNACNVTREQIFSYPPAIEAKNSLQKILEKYCNKYDPKDKYFIVGFNNRKFDDDYLRAFYTKMEDKYFGSMFQQNTIDAMILASEALKLERTSMKKFRLSDVATQFGIIIDESKLHDARYDIYLTRKVYYKSLEKIARTFGENNNWF